MASKLNDKIVAALPLPDDGNKIYYDTEIKGFGCRVTAAGARSFILNYRTQNGLERRYTIGRFPNWKSEAARQEAKRHKAQIDMGGDPVAALTTRREAPTVADLCERYEREHLPKKRPSSQVDDKSMIENDILGSTLRSKKVAEVTFSDVDGLHRKITNGTASRKAAPYRANRVVALLSKMFGLAIRWGMRVDNPAKGIERNQENKRHRYLDGKEIMALPVALDAHEDQQAANIIRLLLLTGARRNEVRTMRWADVDLAEGNWTKPGAATKQKTVHRVPLSVPAIQLLTEIRQRAVASAGLKKKEISEFVFPSKGGYRVEIKNQWAEICEAAGNKGARIHDLRHTYASVLASAGLSLPVIGALLGHTQMQTTMRYSHLFDDPLRKATERAGAIMTGKPSAEVVPMKGAKQ